MRSPLNFKTYCTPSGREIEICVAPPSKFAIEHQHELLPSWNVAISYLIIVLQRSLVSLKESTPEVVQEKNLLRRNFLRFGCSLIFALEDRGAKSDLFDPRTGSALLASSDRLLDDNAVAHAVLGYSTISYQQCSLLTHPVWLRNVYPSTIVTSGSLEVIEPCIREIITAQLGGIKDG